MGITTRLLAFLALSSLLLHTATSVCLPRASKINPLYPFLGDPVPPSSPKRGPPAGPAPATPSSPRSSAPLLPNFPKAPLPSGVQGAVQDLCKKTDNPDLCFSSVKGDLGDLGGKVDVASLLNLQMKACSLQTQMARALSVHIATAPGTPQLVANILQACTDIYDDALDNLETAAKAVAAKDMGTLNSMLSAVMTDYTTCEDGFVERPGVSSPLGHIDDMLGKLASNCLALSVLLK